MFGIGTQELIIILIVALIVFGPSKIPDLAKALGRAVGEFRKATSELKETISADANLQEVKKTFDEAVAQGLREAHEAEREAAGPPPESAASGAGATGPLPDHPPTEPSPVAPQGAAAAGDQPQAEANSAEPALAQPDATSTASSDHEPQPKDRA